MLEDVWTGILWFVTSPQTGSLATGIAAITTLVMAWKLVPDFMADIRSLSAERPGAGLLRGAIALGGVAALTAASAAIVMLMRQP